MLQKCLFIKQICTVTFTLFMIFFCNEFAVDRESDLRLARQTQKFHSQLQLIHFQNP